MVATTRRMSGLAIRRAGLAALGRSSADGCETCGAVVGSCGCNGGGRVAQMRSSSIPRRPPVGGSGSLVANPPSTPPMPPQPYGTDVYDPSESWWGTCKPCAGCSPRQFTDSRWRKMLSALRGAGGDLAGRRAPYLDHLADFTELDTLYSDPTTIGAGLTVNVEVQPEAGCFLAAYYRLVVRTPADGISSVDWTYRKPRIQGCPVPCDNLDRNIAAQFGMSVPEACPCGIPLLAWIQRPGDDLPLQIPITNNTAGDLVAQVEVRGFCCDGRICL